MNNTLFLPLSRPQTPDTVVVVLIVVVHVAIVEIHVPRVVGIRRITCPLSKDPLKINKLNPFTGC